MRVLLSYFKLLLLISIGITNYTCAEIIENTAKQRPNIVVIFVDDLGYGDLSSYGATDIATPNIDEIATQGVKFTDSYAISPICTPSRAGLLTGRYPIRMGVQKVFHAESYTGLPQSEITMAEMLKDAGYHTGMVGKWHLGHHKKYMPLAQGFDYFYGYPYSNDIKPLYAFEGDDIAEWKVDQNTITQTLTTKALDFLNQSKNDNNPFFLYFAQVMPHIPLGNTPGFTGTSQRGQYGDVVQELDWSVGKITDFLKNNGLLENTLLIFASDNGPWLIAEEDGGSAGPLRAGKRTSFEGGMRVPTIVSWPDKFVKNQVSSGITTLLDWYPTIAEATNAKLPEVKIDGKSLINELTTGNFESLTERSFAYYLNGEIEAFRSGDWKIKYPIGKAMFPWPFRLFFTGENDFIDEVHLFNLKEDIGESKNLTNSHPEQLAKMEAEVTEFKNKMGDLPPMIDNGFRISIYDFAKPGLTRMLIISVLTLLTLWLLTIYFSYRWGRRANSKK